MLNAKIFQKLKKAIIGGARSAAKTTDRASVFSFAFMAAALVAGGFFIAQARAGDGSSHAGMLVYPNGGEVLSGVQTIKWDTSECSEGDTIRIWYGYNSSQGAFPGTVEPIKSGLKCSSGEYSWDTNEASDKAGNRNDFIIKIENVTQNGTKLDFSDDYFTIDNTAPSTNYSILPKSPNSVSGWYNALVGAPTVTLSCGDNLSGCSDIIYAWYDAASGAGVVATTTVASSSVSFQAPQGDNYLLWYSTDAAGNAEVLRGPKEVKVDTEIPNAPVLISIAGDDMVNKAEQTAAVVKGKAEPGAAIEVSVSNVPSSGTTVVTATSTGTVSDSGEFSVPVNVSRLDDGKIVVTAVARDAAGNVSSSSEPLDALKDVLSPAADGEPDLTDASDTGDSDSDNYTSDNTPDYFIASCEPDSVVTIYYSAGGTTAPKGSVACPEAGEATVRAEEAGDGTYDVIFTVTDPAGNESGASGPIFVTIDTKAPNAPVVTGIEDDTGISGSDGITNDNEPVFHGTASDDSVSVEVFIDNSSVGATTTAAGAWSLGNPGEPLKDGTYAVTAKASDLAGNVSVSLPFTLVVDTSAPSAPSITSIADDGYINAAEQGAVHIKGSAEPGSVVEAALLSASYSTPPTTDTADASSGEYEVMVNASLLPDGQVVAVVSATDAAGNTSADANRPGKKDTSAPEIVSAVTKDKDMDGRVDAATLKFSEPILLSTLKAKNFVIAGVPADGIGNVGAESANSVLSADIIVSAGVEGTGAKMVAYASGTAADIAGNPLTAYSETSTDAAGPVPMSARTTSTTTIDVVFSEDLHGRSVDAADLVVSGYNVSGITEKNGVVSVTFYPPMGTGSTPEIKVLGNGYDYGMKDLNGNWTPKDYLLTPADGVAPTLTSVSIESNNASTTLAKVGDTINLRFTASENIGSLLVVIGGRPAPLAISPVANKWVASARLTKEEPEGVIPFTIYFEDTASPANAGARVATTTDGSFVLFDKTPPVVDAGADKEVNAMVTQDAQTSDNGSGIASWKWTNETPSVGTVTFGNPNAEDTTISADTDGVYTLKLTVTDNAGNVNSDEMTLIWDTVAPEIEGSSPHDGALNVATAAGTAKIIFWGGNGNIVLSDQSKIALKNNSTNKIYSGTPSVEGGDGNSTTLNIPYSELEPNTTYRINVAAGAVRDVAGNAYAGNFISYFTTSDTPDTAPPDAPVITTPNATVDGDYYTIIGTAADDGGQRIVNLYNGERLAGTAVLAAGNTDWVINVALTQDADNVFTATATDGVGNTSDESNSVTITEATTPDTDKPIIAVLGQNPLTITVGDTYIDPGATAIDAIDGNISADIVFGGTIADGDVATVAGVYTVTYNVSDSAGNAAEEETRTVIVKEAFDDTAELGVTGVTASGTIATADGTFKNGWSWVFSVTVPTDETIFSMKFKDFKTSDGENVIPAANNIRFYSPQSSDANGTSTARMITAAEAFSAGITLNSDLEPDVPGRQIEVIVEMRVPEGSAGGSYSSQYAVKSDYPDTQGF